MPLAALQSTPNLGQGCPWARQLPCDQAAPGAVRLGGGWSSHLRRTVQTPQGGRSGQQQGRQEAQDHQGFEGRHPAGAVVGWVGCVELELASRVRLGLEGVRSWERRCVERGCGVGLRPREKKVRDDCEYLGLITEASRGND